MPSSGQGWTDKEKLAYIIMLLDGTSIDWNKALIPEGRTLIACQKMLQRTKEAVKVELAYLKNGSSSTNATNATNSKSAGTKRSAPKLNAGKKKIAGDENGSKKGQKRTQSVQEDDDEDIDYFVTKKIKIEPKYDEVEEQDIVDDVV
ncbi:uncharacterized protein BDZ99DRAFT_465007 [Mytilinidion resinicola]|uniref:Uncharacterized protein n=1 Tax=Mytilinidion resinicola TaxID=574789 RepID=A0A6A6YH73_9PEZI|nr:uncharacterized protein BDZ99DRAFT_465007 [Mytilinidion resinicola]KAF2808110.1 hypothetical protein BDZ99DRAFT_465007 [Mytilinidion resinicola]